MPFLYLIGLLIMWFLISRSSKARQKKQKAAQPPDRSEPAAPSSAVRAEPVFHVPEPRPLTLEVFFSQHMAAYVAFDLETTGLDEASCRIIEIGAVKIVDGQETESFHTLVNPGRGRLIPPEASAVNHITNEMVASAPGYGTVLPGFLNFIGDLPLVAHNALFDIKFLRVALAELKISKQLAYTDSLAMARQYFSALPSKKLGAVCEAIGYQIGQAHRALDDARAVHAIVRACAEKASVLRETETGHKAHFDLANQIEAAAQLLRKNPENAPEMEDVVLSLCRKDFATVEAARAYVRANGWPDPRFDSFRRAIIIYTKRGDYENAIAVCRQAVALGIPDKDTEGGMAGRLEKLLAKQKAAAEKEAIQQEKAAAMAEKDARKAERQAQARATVEASKRPVLQFTYDGTELIKQHESIASAAKEIGVDKSCIRDAAKGRQKHAGGFTWKYSDEHSQVEQM